MRKSSITAVFRSDLQTVWNVVTNNQNASWRSDLNRIEILDERTFVEYPRRGNPTTFTITEKQPCSRYAFHLENRLFSGEWMGLFLQLPKGGTQITFTESINIRNPVIRLLSYFMMNLSKIQQIYIQDLKTRLGE